MADTMIMNAAKNINITDWFTPALQLSNRTF